MAVLTLPNTSTASLSVRAKALVFEDRKTLELKERIEQVGPSSATVLIVGETGTGKEIVARHVHALSARRDKPFVAVNCGAFADSLVESELFGHERGAFTGALTAKTGWFEAAHGGTLFLDEIGDLPLSIQVKLLRVLQEGEVVRLGSRQPIPIDVRLVAATNVELEEAVQAGKFREDLYYRLNVAALELPPLRDRPGDILPLARYFIEMYRERLGAGVTALSPSAERRLLEHHWPGNIRELENAVHHALLVCRGSAIRAEDLRLTGLPPRAASPAAAAPVPEDDLERALQRLFEQGGPELHERIEEAVFRTAYRYCEKNQVQTAKLLGISRNIVRARLIECGELTGSVRPPPPDQRMPESSRLPRLGRAARRVRIGYQRLGPLMLLKARRSLERVLEARGVEVEWREFPAGLQMVDALSDDRLNLGVMGEGPPIFAQAAELPIVYLGADAACPEGEGILVHADSPIVRVEQLRGKTIALNKGANVHYLLIRALEEAHVDYDDVNIEFVTPEAGQAAFESRRVDAWGIWDPVLTAVQQATGARVLRDGLGLAANAAYYIGTRGFVESHADVVDVFLGELERTRAWAKEHPAAAVEALSRESGLPRPALAVALSRAEACPPSSFGEQIASQQAVADSFLRVHLISRKVAVRHAQWHHRGPFELVASSSL